MSSETRDSEDAPQSDTQKTPLRDANLLPKSEGADPSVDVPVWPEMLVRSEAEEWSSEDEIDEQEENK